VAAVVYGITAMVDALAPDSWQPYTDVTICSPAELWLENLV
jgi:hypothetical protein